MTTDHELLEAAAKAAGMAVLPEGVPWPPEKSGWFFNDAGGNFGLFDRGSRALTMWNPLTDDGDALRLAVKLGIGVRPHLPTHWHNPSATVALFDLPEDGAGCVEVPHATDPGAATRRAIVRAAAAMSAALAVGDA